MDLTKKTLALLISNSLLLAAGILLVVFACILYHTGWPLLMILCFSGGIFILTLCGSLRISGLTEDLFGEGEGSWRHRFSYALASALTTLGFFIPVTLLRKQVFQLGGLYMSISGGTVILMACILFVKIVYY